jgi:heme a synthase
MSVRRQPFNRNGFEKLTFYKQNFTTTLLSTQWMAAMTSKMTSNLVSSPRAIQTVKSSQSKVFIPQPSATPPGTGIALQRYMAQGIFLLAIAVLGLMALGSATRVMNAGLSCPDWPLCYGQVLPSQQMNLQVFLEWFHRVVATTIGFTTLVFFSLSIWQRHQLPTWLPKAMGFAMLVVLWQGVLGGLTVTQLLRFDIVTAHLGTGLFFFMTLLTIAVALYARETHSQIAQDIQTAHVPHYLWQSGAIAVACIYGQSLLGGIVASRWALHQCFGQQQLCTVMNSHLVGVIPATLSAIVVIILALRSPELPRFLHRVIYGSGVCLGLQLLLGYATFRLHLQVEPLTVAHQFIGASLLGTIVFFTASTYRLRAR